MDLFWYSDKVLCNRSNEGCLSKTVFKCSDAKRIATEGNLGGVVSLRTWLANKAAAESKRAAKAAKTAKSSSTETMTAHANPIGGSSSQAQPAPGSAQRADRAPGSGISGDIAPPTPSREVMAQPAPVSSSLTTKIETPSRNVLPPVPLETTSTTTESSARKLPPPPPVMPVGFFDKGIVNMGATCYIAAALQGLLHSRHFSSFLLNARAVDGSIRSAGVMNAVRGILEALHDGTSREALSVRPVQSELEKFTENQGMFLNRAADSANAVRNMLHAFTEAYPEENDLFGMGVNVERPCVKCGYTLKGGDSKRLSEVLRVDQSCSLGELLHKHYDSFDLQNAKCQNCPNRPATTKVFKTIVKTPDVLVFSIVRDAPNVSVDIPLELDLSQLVARYTSDGKSPVYRLSAVVRGTGGHFVTDYWNPDSGKWMNANDSHISPLPRGPTLSGVQPYVLFYDRV